MALTLELLWRAREKQNFGASGIAKLGATFAVTAQVWHLLWPFYGGPERSPTLACPKMAKLGLQLGNILWHREVP